MTNDNTGDAAVAASPGNDDAAVERFARTLEPRLKLRKRDTGEFFYVLDLRHRRFGKRNPVTLRDPSAVGWPDGGETTDDLTTAKRWVRHHYARKLQLEIDIQISTGKHALNYTVRDAAQRYVASLAIMRRMPDGSTVMEIPRKYASRVSNIRQHIVPKYGSLRLVDLSAAKVRQMFEDMTVLETTTTGEKVKCAASYGTKLNTKRALNAIWQVCLEDHVAPFRDVMPKAPDIPGIDEDDDDLVDLENEDALLAEANGALTPNQLTKGLIAASYYDRTVCGRKNIRSIAVSNTAHAMAAQTGLGTRISELMALRWGHINWDEEYVEIPSAKRRQKKGMERRAVPLQRTLRPWLEELRELAGGNPGPNDRVFRTNPKAALTTKGVPSTLGRRFSEAMRLAGIKIVGKATHGLRATHISLGLASPKLSDAMLRMYVGHGKVVEGTTAVYVRQIIAKMLPQHREYLEDLPSPDEVRKGLESFKPAERLHWKKRRVVKPRTKEEKAAAKERRLARKPLGTSVDRRR